MIDTMLLDPTRVADVNNLTVAEIRKAREHTSEAIKAVLLVSGADKRRYGRLKDEFVNNYPSEVQSKMIIMGHQISSFHVLVVRSFFIL
jgi:hypothetical protein